MAGMLGAPGEERFDVIGDALNSTSCSKRLGKTSM